MVGHSVDAQGGHNVRVVDRRREVSDVVKDDPGAVTGWKRQKTSKEEEKEGQR